MALLKPRQHGWLVDRIDRGFTWLRSTYARLLAATLGARGAVLFVWIALSLLTVPLYLFSNKELAPLEDQGVVFGAVDVPPNATSGPPAA